MPIFRHNGQWSPGSRPTIPHLEILALVCGFACAISTIFVLTASNGKSTTTWPTKKAPVQPAVMLAILTALSNSLLLYAFQKGSEIAWWLKMLAGSDINESHRYWAYGASAFSSVSAGKHFNKVAFACLAITIVAIDGPLLQRASSSTSRVTTQSTRIEAQLFDGPLPSNYSGYYFDHLFIDMVTSDLMKVIKSYQNRDPISVSYSGCSGTCHGTVVAPGFDVNCTSGTQAYDMSYNITDISIPNVADHPKWVVGLVHVEFDGSHGGDYSSILVKTLFKSQPEATGNLSTNSCVLHLAKTQYPVVLINNTIAPVPRPPGINDTLELLYIDPEPRSLNLYPSSIGGIAVAAQALFGSNLTMKVSSATGYLIESSGPLGINYRSPIDLAQMNGASMTWTDPAADIISAIREITFRAGVATSNASTFQQFDATETAVGTFYVSHYEYLAGALVVMVIGLCAVTTLFFDFWRLGRPVTLSPVEVAKAFSAPALAGGNSNAEVRGLLKKFGKKKMRYGIAISRGDDGCASQPLTKSPDDPSIEEEADNQPVEEMLQLGEKYEKKILRLADPDEVTWPTNGVYYVD